MPLNPLTFKFPTPDGKKITLEPGKLYVTQPYPVYVETNPKRYVTRVIRFHRHSKRRMLKNRRYWGMTPSGRVRWVLEVEVLADNCLKANGRCSEFGMARSFFASKFTFTPIEPIELMLYLDLPHIYPGMQEAITKGQ